MLESVLANFTISLVTNNKIFKVDIDLVHNKKCLASTDAKPVLL